MPLVIRDEQAHTLDATNTAATIAVDAGTGANRACVAVAWWRNNGGHAFNAPTYNGDALTQRVNLESGTQYRLMAWMLDGPDTGTNNLVFTPTGGTGAGAFCLLGWAFLYEVDVAAVLADLPTYLATGSNNAAGASFTTTQAVGGSSGGIGLLFAGMRDGTAARTATAGDLVGALSQTSAGAQATLAQGLWTSDGGTDTPTMTWNNDGSDFERHFALVFPSAAPAGPTITVQPTADTGLINGDATRRTTVYTGTATGTTISAFTWEVGGTPIADGGIYDIVTTGIGTGSASSTLTIERTAKVGTPFNINFDVTDANGTTASNTVTDTWYTGPTISTTSGTTDGSGEDVITCASDYPNDQIDGEYTEFSATAGGITKTVAVVFQTP